MGRRRAPRPGGNDDVGAAMFLWRAANAVMAALFVFAVVVQGNDPDPVRWMLVYAAAAIACALVTAGRTAWPIAAATALIAGAWAIAWRADMHDGLAPLSSLFDQFEMRDDRIEETRELLGLCIVVAWCAVVALQGRLRRRGR